MIFVEKLKYCIEYFIIETRLPENDSAVFFKRTTGRPTDKCPEATSNDHMIYRTGIRTQGHVGPESQFHSRHGLCLAYKETAAFPLGDSGSDDCILKSGELCYLL